MIKEINDFTSLFGSSLKIDEQLIVRRENRVFLINEILKTTVPVGFFYAGTFLGRIIEGKLHPGFELLRIIAGKKANAIVVDKKTEWLFICGRDIFKQGITKTVGTCRKGEHVLVLNVHRECLGYGRILCDLVTAKSGLAVKNILDLGDFLRREKETNI